MDLFLEWLPFLSVIVGFAAFLEGAKRSWRRLLKRSPRPLRLLEGLLPLLPVLFCPALVLSPGVMPDGWSASAALGLGAFAGGMSSWAYAEAKRIVKSRAAGLKLPAPK